MTDSSTEEPPSHPGRWRLTLRRGPQAPAQARREIARLGLAPARAEDLALLVSEVVTNAIRHGGARDDQHVVVEIAVGSRRIRVRVLDGGRRIPTPRKPGYDGGFGLHLVDSLAERWGAAPGEVWFELPATG